MATNDDDAAEMAAGPRGDDEVMCAAPRGVDVAPASLPGTDADGCCNDAAAAATTADTDARADCLAPTKGVLRGAVPEAVEVEAALLDDVDESGANRDAVVELVALRAAAIVPGLGAGGTELATG